MAGPEQEGAALKAGNGGVLGWLRRLIAGAEIEALEQRAAKMAREAEAARSESAAATSAIADLKKQFDERERRLAESERVAETTTSACRAAEDELTRAKAALDELEKRAAAQERSPGAVRPPDLKASRRIAELEGLLNGATRARDEADRRLAEATSKLEKAQAAIAPLEKTLAELQARAKASEQGAARKIAELEQRTRQSSGALTAASDSATILEMRVAELEGMLEGVTRDREAERASREEQTAGLERRLVEALASPREPTTLEDVLTEREALVDELERALVAQRSALELRDTRLAAQAEQLTRGLGAADARPA